MAEQATLTFTGDSSPDSETKKKAYISKKLRRAEAKKIERKITAKLEHSILTAFVGAAKPSIMNVTAADNSPAKQSLDVTPGHSPDARKMLTSKLPSKINSLDFAKEKEKE